MPPGPIRSSDGKKSSKTDARSNANQERAYIAASRRRDRSIEARLESARRASELHQERTGKRFKITEKIVIDEEMYEEEDPKFDLMRLQMAKNNTWPSNSPFGYQSSQPQNSMMNPLHIFPFQPSTQMDESRSRLQIQTQINSHSGLESLSSFYAQSPTSSIVMSPTALTPLSPGVMSSPQIHPETFAQTEAMRRMSEASIDNLPPLQNWNMNYLNLQHNQAMLRQSSHMEMKMQNDKEIGMKQQHEQSLQLPAEDVSGTYFGFQLSSQSEEKFNGGVTQDSGSSLMSQTSLDPEMQAKLDTSLPELHTDLHSQDISSQLAQLDQAMLEQEGHPDLHSPVSLRNESNQLQYSDVDYSFGQLDHSFGTLIGDSGAFDEFCVIPKHQSQG